MTYGTEIVTTDGFLTPEFQERVEHFKKAMHDKYLNISQTETPKVDGKGRKIIDTRPDGYDYIIEAYMREQLDHYFPGWSWECAAPIQVLGADWVIAQGHLIIIDENLLAFGIQPPLRKFFGADAARIMYKRDMARTTDNIVDVGNNVKGANSSALKVAINRLCHIGDDVYKKRIDPEGAGSLEDVIIATGDSSLFRQYVDTRGLRWGKVCKVLNVKSPEDITDFAEALKKLKEVGL